MLLPTKFVSRASENWNVMRSVQSDWLFAPALGETEPMRGGSRSGKRNDRLALATLPLLSVACTATISGIGLFDAFASGIVNIFVPRKFGATVMSTLCVIDNESTVTTR